MNKQQHENMTKQNCNFCCAPDRSHGCAMVCQHLSAVDALHHAYCSELEHKHKENGTVVILSVEGAESRQEVKMNLKKVKAKKIKENGIVLFAATCPYCGERNQYPEDEKYAQEYDHCCEHLAGDGLCDAVDSTFDFKKSESGR